MSAPPGTILIAVTPEQLQWMNTLNQTWPILLFATIILGGLHLLLIMITPSDAKAITRARVFGGVLALVKNQFNVAKIVRGTPALDGRALECGSGIFYFTPGAQASPDVNAYEFTALNEAVKEATILGSIGKPILLGFDTHGIVFQPSLVETMITAQEIAAGKKKTPKGFVLDTTPPADKIQAAVEEAITHKKKVPTFLELISLEAVKVFLNQNFGREIITLLEARYERRGQFGKSGHGNSRILFIIIIAIVAFVLFIMFAGPLLNGLLGGGK